MTQGNLPEGASRVQEFLRSKNYELTVQLLPDSTATAQNAADSLGVKLNQIGKSIVFGNEDETIIAVICGDQKVNSKLLLPFLKVPEISLLNADDVKKITGFVIGGVSPFALPQNVNIFIDENLYKQPVFYVAAGHPKAVVRVCGNDIVTLTGAIICSLT